MIAHHRSAPAPPFARGEAFGRAHAGAIAATLARYRGLFGAGADLDSLGATALAATRAYAPDSAEEIEGLAAGAGLPVAHVAALNARTELLARARGECTTLVLLGDPVVAVQTWDWHEELAGAWLVWTIEHPDGRVVHTLTEYGILGKIGVCSAGLGVHLNILYHAADGGPPGVPVHVLARHVLDHARDAGDALDRLAAADVSASSALTVVSPHEAATAELHPGGPALVRPDADGVLAHANHFLAAPGDLAHAVDPGSFARLDDLRSRLAARPRPRDRDAALDVLRSHAGGADAICCHPGPAAPAGERWATLATVALDPAAGALAVRAGGPCRPGGGWWSTPGRLVRLPFGGP